MKGYRLPPGLMLGASTSASQIEGGYVRNNWTRWERLGRLNPGASDVSVSEAIDHKKRWKEDIDIASAMGLETYRFSVEWARIEPAPGVFDRLAIAAYREEISYMLDRGIKPLLTIHHYTNPLWFERLGAFARPENVKYYMKFVGVVVNSFGDLVSDYCTFNEPNTYVLMGYTGLGFPPGKSDLVEARRVISVMAGCHILAYRKIHRMRKAMGYRNTRVGFAMGMKAFAPLRKMNARDRISAKVSAHVFQDDIMLAFGCGKFRFPLENLGRFEEGSYLDYTGINYFTRSRVKRPGDDLMQSGTPKSDAGWEIYPKGLEECVKEAYAMTGKPVWILENGVCDNQDAFRALFIYDHLSVLASVRVPVERYYYSDLFDDFQWLDGVSRRCGLVEVNFRTKKRSVKQSGLFYREIIQMGGVTEEMADRYAAGQTYPLR